ncbi:MAG: polymerase, sigma-24 subunit, subfamily [Solirubrobacteraceae bacterium]|nr:polymerase, sigma-24 subunit, subfamily [Solirubrobacteraceae bacterium]
MTGSGPHEFEELWARHHRRVHAYALRRTDRSSAQDVVSETFLTAWRRRADLPTDEMPWLLGIARHVLANHARTQRRREALAEVLIEQAHRAHAEPVEVDRDLLHAIAALRPDDREALILVGWDGLRPSEAAKVVGCRPATFRVRLLRARRRLDARLQPTEPGTLMTVETEPTR